MTISASEAARVRRMVNELTEATYTDGIIEAMAEDHAYTVNNWPDADTIGYDLHAIAAEIWEEKAAVLSPDYDFTEQGVGSYQRSQAYEQAMNQAAYHFERRKAKSHRPQKSPREVEVDVTL